MGEVVALVSRDGHKFDAYVARPQKKAIGTVVLVQEIFGVNHHIRSIADSYAAEGYLAVAPALFDRVLRGYEAGYTQAEVAAGLEIMKQITWDMALADISEAVALGAGDGSVGIVGYCWGGAVSWLAASRIAGVGCAVAYYGGAIPTLLSDQPVCPMMLHFGEKDQSIPLEKAKLVIASSPKSEAFFYPAGHGFNCDERGSFDVESAKIARSRTIDFLNKHLS